MGLQLGGGELVLSGFPGFLLFFSFFFFSMLHHPEPNRAMLVGIGGGGVAATVSANGIVPFLFRNGNGSYSVITRLQ